MTSDNITQTLLVLSSVLHHCVRSYVTQPHARGHFADASRIILKAVKKCFGDPSAVIKLEGSMGKGTDLKDADGDFVVGTSVKVTRSLRAKLREELCAEFFGCEAKSSHNSICFKKVTIPPHQTSITIDVCFSNATFGVGGVDNTKFDLPPSVQAAVRFLKLFRLVTDSGLANIDGLHLEAIVGCTYLEGPAYLHHICQQNAELGMLLLIVKSVTLLNRGGKVTDIALKMRNFSRDVSTPFIDAGQLEQWKQKGQNFLYRLERYMMRDEQDFRTILRGRGKHWDEQLEKRGEVLDLVELVADSFKVCFDFCENS
ncbi:hypothetical protein HDV00_005246 [Rhizophlyctis rosea]|nr:hypothetical protein HDV00_005246 [Rhizophlyctis rosea]